MPEWQVPDEFFSVYIPKIDAISRVVENVDSASKVAYQNALKMGVAQAAGLAAPGTRGTTYLFSHSVSNPINFARYNAVFYLLDRLAIGDGVEIVYKGKYLKYEVTDMVKLPASDTRYLQPQDAEEKLVLQTCWPPGTTLQRLYVVAKRVY
jgi:sortase A